MVAVAHRKRAAPTGSLNIIRELRRDFLKLPARPLGSGQMVRQLALDEKIAGSTPASPANTFWARCGSGGSLRFRARFPCLPAQDWPREPEPEPDWRRRLLPRR